MLQPGINEQGDKLSKGRMAAARCSAVFPPGHSLSGSSSAVLHCTVRKASGARAEVHSYKCVLPSLACGAPGLLPVALGLLPGGQSVQLLGSVKAAFKTPKVLSSEAPFSG